MRLLNKTRPWVITLSVGVIVFLYFLISWLLVGELDLLNKDWIVGSNGILWDGKLTPSNIDWLWNKYEDVFNHYGNTYQELKEWADKGMNLAVISPTMIFNPYILLILFGGLILAISYPFIFKLFKWGNYDIIPFSVTSALICFVFFISALIPHWGSTDDVKKNLIWYDLVRLLLSAVVGLGSFFFINWIVNKFYITNENAQALANELKQNKKSADVYNNDLRDLVSIYRENDKDYIELDDVTKKK